MYNRPLIVSSLTKTFDTPSGPYVAVKDFTTQIAPGEIVAFLGHSGCGKSTVLSIMAGLQDATFGGVIVNGKEISGPSLERALVFQSPSLLPWLTALENVLLAVRQVHTRERGSRQREIAMHYLELAGIAEFAHQLPAELSLGTQQRVAIARALSQEPQYLLLDEPFGMLDSFTRFELQDLVLELWRKHPKSIVMVTHDVDEALYMCDRIVLMTDGPEARAGLDLTVNLPRPRDREALLDSQEYFELRAHIIQFLEDHSRQFVRQ